MKLKAATDYPEGENTMSITAEELIREILNSEAESKELMAAMSEPDKVAEFLKAHDCSANVSDFIRLLDRQS